MAILERTFWGPGRTPKHSLAKSVFLLPVDSALREWFMLYTWMNY